jgi:hypothetical protein
MRRSLFTAVLCSAAVLGCPGPQASTDAGVMDAGLPDAGSHDAGTDAGTPALDAGSCSLATFGGGEATWVGASVTASLVDQTGAPVVGQPAYICGLDLCSPPKSFDAQGHVSITTALSMKRPAFKFGDALTYAEFGIPLVAADTTFGTLVTAKLPTTGAVLTPGAVATSGGVSLSLAAGTVIGLDTLTYDTADKQQLRIAAVPVSQAAPQLPSGSDFTLLYGLSPAGTLLCPKAQVTVPLPHATQTPNDFGWAPGAAVEFWVTTVDVSQSPAPYAGWARLSDGVVSADGTSVSTTEGFAALQNFAVRLK